MISHNGWDWTDKEETLDLDAKFQEGLPAHVVQSEGFHKPVCEMYEMRGGRQKKYGCGKTTSYIVLPGNWRALKKFWFIGIGVGKGGESFKHDGLIYVPVPLCVSCEAARSGYEIGVNQPDRHEKAIDGVRKGPYTPQEVETYIEVFNRAYNKGCGARTQQEVEGQKKKSKSRYQPQQEARAA